MNKEDFPLVIFEGSRLRLVPEMPRPLHSQMCEMCLGEDKPLGGPTSTCYRLRQRPREEDCGYHPEDKGPTAPEVITWEPMGYIYLPEERFEEYVVELVRRRIS